MEHTFLQNYRNVKLKWNFIWDIIEIDWKGVNVPLNENKVNLTNSVAIMF